MANPAGSPFCPAETTLELISGRWKPLVIWRLLKGERRFNQLQRDLSQGQGGAITHRTLTRALREMEASGLVERRDYGEVPPRVGYSLTEKGRSLAPVLAAMEAWALAHGESPRGRRTSG